MNQEDFFNIFRTDRAQMEQAVSAGLSSGGDWCDLYFEYTVYNDLLLKDGEVNDGSYNEDFGVGIRVLDGEKTGYAYSESTGLKDMLAAARAASSIAGGRGRQERIPAIETGRGRTGRSSVMGKGIRTDGIGNPEAGGYMDKRLHQDLYPVVRTWDKEDHGKFLPLLKRIDASVRSKDGSVVKVMVHLADYQSYIMMFNSMGELTADSRPMCSITVTAVFSRNGKTLIYTVAFPARYLMPMTLEAGQTPGIGIKIYDRDSQSGHAKQNISNISVKDGDAFQRPDLYTQLLLTP